MSPVTVEPAPSKSAEVKFDDYAREYHSLHDKSVTASGESPEYFARYKLGCLERLGVEGPILDYGCGIGNLLSLLGGAFAEVHGYDPSQESLRVAQERAPQAQLHGELEAIPSGYFGSAVLAGVLHHIAPPERNDVLRTVYHSLKPGGRVVIFEHNPLNPLTLKAVRDCPFDDDAILLPARELRKRLSTVGFDAVRLRYIVFFPNALSGLRAFEPDLGLCPLGAQTMTVGERPLPASAPKRR